VNHQGFESQQEQHICLLPKSSRPVLGHHIQRVTWFLFGGKAAGTWSWPLKLYLLPGLRMRGVVPLPPHLYVLMAWTGNTFPLIRCWVIERGAVLWGWASRCPVLRPLYYFDDEGRPWTCGSWHPNFPTKLHRVFVALTRTHCSLCNRGNYQPCGRGLLPLPRAAPSTSQDLQVNEERRTVSKHSHAHFIVWQCNVTSAAHKAQ